MFVESSKSLFAVSSLSHLVSASFTEDDFGVVQKKLADILELLVSLYDAVEKNIKVSFPEVATVGYQSQMRLAKNLFAYCHETIFCQIISHVMIYSSGIKQNFDSL